MAYQTVILKQLNEGCAAVRKAVFMEEQGFQQEFDDVDDRAYHVLIQDGERPVATGRLFTEDGETYLIGRVAVLSAYRAASGRTRCHCTGTAGEGMRCQVHYPFGTMPCGRLL